MPLRGGMRMYTSNYPVSGYAPCFSSRTLCALG